MVDPLVVVSVFGTADSRATICAAGASAAAAAGTAAAAGQSPRTTGCVLPVVDGSPPVAGTAPASIAPVGAAVAGAGPVQLLLGLASIVGFAAIVLDSLDERGHIDLPISP